MQPRITLFVPPSGCSRYMAILLDGIANESGTPMLVVDRPGVGAVPMVDGTRRMQTSTDNLISVLEALGVEQLNVLTHSAGSLYSLELMRRMPHLFTQSSRIVFSSPFVPTHLSSSALSLLPASVVRLAPAANNLLNSCGKAFAWSAGVSDQIGLPKLSSGGEPSPSKEAARRSASIASNPHAKFHPPYSPVLPGDHTKLILDYFNKEDGVVAATQDFLFCLGKAPYSSSAQLEAWMQERLGLLAQVESLVVVWGETDFMIPQQGRTHFASALQKHAIHLDEWVMAQAGHDEPPASLQVMRQVFGHLNGLL
ncbi:unnamed protein product [Sympodiomycopsis kandeliae]